MSAADIFNRRDLLAFGLRCSLLFGLGGLLSGCGSSRSKGLRVIEYPDPRLREAAAGVAEIDDSLIALAREMMVFLRHKSQFDFLSKGSLHPGLAAPQIGVARRMIICALRGELQALVNPEIISRGGRYASYEKCLSLPGHDIREVKRSTSARVSYQSLAGQEETIEVGDRYAALMEHEIDHLNGVLYIDY